MAAYALYRLPYENHCTLIEQTTGEPRQFASVASLDGEQGFVVAPFCATAAQPVLLIRPDRMTTLPIEKPAGQVPDMLHAHDYREDYTIDFANFHAQLSQGTFRKIVLARCAEIETAQAADPRQLFWQACQRYPRLFITLFSLPDGTCWLMATPEILLEGTADRWRTIALAGTMQLEGADLNGEGERVCWSAKNIQEQRYVATYIAECLERFDIDFHEEAPRTVRAAQLVHLRSDFIFHASLNHRVGSLLDMLHPTPAVCGLPKREALDFILSNERFPRQYYSGFVGPLLIEQSTHLYVSLRCMHICGSKYQLYAGGGLLPESIEEQEWQETEAKMKTMRSLLASRFAQA